jgi:hypothetical protein
MMNKSRKVVVKKERTVHTYSELWQASHCVLKTGIEEPKGSSWQFLSSVVLTAFTFEAYLNHIGSHTIECWEQLERLPPWSKFELLCETLDVSFPEGKGARPLQTVAKLLVFRNTIAHGRTIEIKGKPEICDADDRLDGYLGKRLQTDWEKLIQTKDFAQLVHEDVQVVLTRLHAARKDDKEYLFRSGLHLGSATLQE